MDTEANNVNQECARKLQMATTEKLRKFNCLRGKFPRKLPYHNIKCVLDKAMSNVFSSSITSLSVKLQAHFSFLFIL